MSGELFIKLYNEKERFVECGENLHAEATEVISSPVNRYL